MDELQSNNRTLVDVLKLIGYYYELSNDKYRARSFMNASNNILDHSDVIISGAQARKEIRGIGASIEEVIDEFIETGKVKRLEELQRRFDEVNRTISLFTSIFGIGPTTAVKFYNQGYRTLEDLWFNANLTSAQRTGIVWRYHIDKKVDRNEVDIISNIIDQLLPNVKHVITGSYRRGEQSSNDIDLLVEQVPGLTMNVLLEILKQYIPATLSQGLTKFMGIIRINDNYYGHRIDIRLATPESFPAMLLYFTGSQRFNILMRQRAKEFNLTLNEYGLYTVNDAPLIINDERDIFDHLRVKYLEPRERTRTLSNLPIY